MRKTILRIGPFDTDGRGGGSKQDICSPLWTHLFERVVRPFFCTRYAMVLPNTLHSFIHSFIHSFQPSMAAGETGPLSTLAPLPVDSDCACASASVILLPHKMAA